MQYRAADAVAAISFQIDLLAVVRIRYASLRGFDPDILGPPVRTAIPVGLDTPKRMGADCRTFSATDSEEVLSSNANGVFSLNEQGS
jgi:hypothetical protein